MLCFEDKEAFEILLALDFYLRNICAQSMQAMRIWFASAPTAHIFCTFSLLQS
jgi:hypothetical protein